MLLTISKLIFSSLYIFFVSLQVTSVIDFSKNACKDYDEYPTAFISRRCYENPEINSNTAEVIAGNGYNVSIYSVQTPDGYILTMFRIPPRSDDFRKQKQPVFLQHGISASSFTWVDIKERSLAFNLADEGYDVWLGNLRGTEYSRKHLKYSDGDMKFWNYNLDILATNDVRWCLKKIASVTGKSGSIIYMGHSLGTTLGFMYASEFSEEANSLLRGIVAAAPIVYFETTDKNSKMAISLLLMLGKMLLYHSLPAFIKHPERLRTFFREFCRFLPQACLKMIRYQYGNTDQMRPDDLLLYYAAYPDTISITQLLHYGQMLQTGNFQKYNYGLFENVLKYGQARAPLYNLSNIEVPVFLLYGKNDNLMSEKALHRTFSELGSTKKFLYSVPMSTKETRLQFNHMDFTFSRYVKELFYKDLFRFLSQDLAPVET